MRRWLLAFFVIGAIAPAFAKDNTSTTLSASPTAVLRGNTVTLTAMVTRTGASGTPGGTVTFAAAGQTLGASMVGTNGVATFSAPTSTSPLGVFPVTAHYSGDSADNPSSSASVNVAVQSATSTSMSLVPGSIQQGQSGVLTAQVARIGNAGNATGTVTFLYGSVALATATLADGVAQISVSSGTTSLGSYNITARYNGDPSDQSSISSAVVATITPAVDVLTFRNNAARTGLQAAEARLTPSNVNPSAFGKVFSFATDGYTYAQPLYVSNYLMGDGKLHNVLIVANATGTIYAFDADNNNPSSGYLWKTSIVGSGEQVVTYQDTYGCGNPYPNTGIIGTPVIDRTLGVMYVIGKTKIVSGQTTTYMQKIHAIGLAAGLERMNGPTIISATVPGTGDGSSTVTFDPLSQNERAAMLESNGSVWITWASHCDSHTYHGWIIGYNRENVSQQTAVYNNTPNGARGGIWMVSGGISTDYTGNLFAVGGNGTFDANDGGPDYGDTIQRFTIGSNSLTNPDWFTPTNELMLADNDLDFGTADALLFDDPASGVAPHLLMTADKTGRVYLLNRYDLGGFDTGPQMTNGDLQDFVPGGSIFTNLGYFNDRVYIGAADAPLYAFDYTPGTLTTAGFLSTTPSMSTAISFSNSCSTCGTQPMFSANSTANAIAWSLDLSQSNAVLYAFDANNLATQLYSSSSNASRDQGPAPVKFTVPVIANGRVYVAGQNSVAAYGLLQ